MERIVTNTFMFENGERYCHIIDKKTGEPLYDPTLYITTRVRNRSESINTMEAVSVQYKHGMKGHQLNQSLPEKRSRNVS
nr:hypothetical protein B7L52_03065 [Pectobacterium carotovorum]